MLILLACYPVSQVMYFGLKVISLHQTLDSMFAPKEAEDLKALASQQN